MVLVIILCVSCITAYRQPKNLKETTGTIKEFKQHEPDWLDYIFSNSGAYLRIWLDDSSYFETSGISYKNINKELFDKISVGSEIKITYDSKLGRANLIYSLEYEGAEYMPLNAVLDGFRENSKIMTAVGVSVLCVSVVVGGVLMLIFGYKYKKSQISI